ncbi:uncharacterized protein [Diadema antillarum]|uniref:uncharacterized protein n=1 Tax=Diadema antillarum TaxID=105358 RepID=UPI003A83BE3A
MIFGVLRRGPLLRSSEHVWTVKRLMKEAQELSEPTEQYFAQPLEDNLFEWHFTVRGPPESDFAGGVYHGRITLPPEYPMKPPSIMLLTPTGRFEVGTKICLSISGHHPETWQPSWSIRTVLLAIIGFMPTKGEGAIGSLDYTPDERKVLARKSQEWKCDKCGTPNRSILPAVTAKSASMQREAAELAAKIQFKKEVKKSEGSSTSPTQAAPPNNPVPPPPFPPNPFNALNQQPGAMPQQPPFVPFPPNFMLQGQAPFGLGNYTPHVPPTQAPADTAGRGSSQQGPPSTPTDSKTEESNKTTGGGSQSLASQPTSQSQSSSGASSSDAVRQRTNVPSRTSTAPQAASQRASPPASGARPVDRGVEGLLCPLVTMSILSFIIIILILRRFYIMYEYKFT